MDKKSEKITKSFGRKGLIKIGTQLGTLLPKVVKLLNSFKKSIHKAFSSEYLESHDPKTMKMLLMSQRIKNTKIWATKCTFDVIITSYAKIFEKKLLRC